MSSTGKGPIVIIDDDKSICRTLKLHFERIGHQVTTAHTAESGLEIFKSFSSAIIILDLMLPDASGIDLLKEIRGMGKSYYSIMVTAFHDLESTVIAVKNGVGEYIHKPIDINELESAVQKGNNILFSEEDKSVNFIPVPALNGSSVQFISKSQIMKELFKTVGMVSMCKTTVHVTGDSGTGKELIAQAIHQNSAERDEPFISINCSAIVETLLESEMFGHEKGSFTGAINRKVGKFSQARKGTIFLDEIGEMDINLQAKLLRVIQEKEFEMVGGNETIKTNCRVISATNRNLANMVKEGKFREDLYYRLNVIGIHLPPLRDRKEDIPDMVTYFVGRACREVGKNIRFVSEGSIEYLMAQPWTGNVRQLENSITSAVIMSHSDRLTKSCFTKVLKSGPVNHHIDEPTGPVAMVDGETSDYLPRTLEDIEKEQIGMALNFTKWHKGRACDILGLTRPRLERKLNKYALRRPLMISDHAPAIAGAY